MKFLFYIALGLVVIVAFILGQRNLVGNVTDSRITTKTSSKQKCVYNTNTTNLDIIDLQNYFVQNGFNNQKISSLFKDTTIQKIKFIKKGPNFDTEIDLFYEFLCPLVLFILLKMNKRKLTLYNSEEIFQITNDDKEYLQNFNLDEIANKNKELEDHEIYQSIDREYLNDIVINKLKNNKNKYIEKLQILASKNKTWKDILSGLSILRERYLCDYRILFTDSNNDFVGTVEILPRNEDHIFMIRPMKNIFMKRSETLFGLKVILTMLYFKKQVYK